jgi:glycerate dehydrogenase
MIVIASDVNRGDRLPYEGFEWVEVEQLFERADVVSLHCPLTPENRGLAGAARLSRMKSHALLVNTSRGPLVVEQDLADALAAGRLAGAALDVLPSEPPVAGSPLLTAPNCLVTPHIAWATTEARRRLLDQAVANAEEFLNGAPANVVNP